LKKVVPRQEVCFLQAKDSRKHRRGSWWPSIRWWRRYPNGLLVLLRLIVQAKYGSSNKKLLAWLYHKIYTFIQHIYNFLQSIHRLHVSALLGYHPTKPRLRAHVSRNPSIQPT